MKNKYYVIKVSSFNEVPGFVSILYGYYVHSMLKVGLYGNAISQEQFLSLSDQMYYLVDRRTDKIVSIFIIAPLNAEYNIKTKYPLYGIINVGESGDMEFLLEIIDEVYKYLKENYHQITILAVAEHDLTDEANRQFISFMHGIGAADIKIDGYNDDILTMTLDLE